MRACNRRLMLGHAAGSASRMIHVILQAAFAAKVRRPRACLAPSVPAAHSTTVAFGGRWLARLRLLALFRIAVGRGRGGGVCSPSSRRCCSHTVRTAFRRAVRGRLAC